VALEWRFLVDWDGVGGLNLGSFETGLDEWAALGGDATPDLSLSTTRAYDGDQSLLVAWKPDAGSSRGLARRMFGGFVPGRTATLTAWVWVPAGDISVAWIVPSMGIGAASAVAGGWTQIAVTFTPTGTTHDLQLWPTGNPTAGDIVYVDRIRVTGPGADITARVQSREPVTISYGRDQYRSLSPAGPAEASLLLDNRSRDYTPENATSPLAGYVLPNRGLLVEATWGGKAHTLFRGATDAFTVMPGREDRSVQVTVVDALAAFRGEVISTDLHVGIRTGQAVHAILDAVGWPAHARDVDAGATAIRFWWEEQTDAGAALDRVVRSEGPPATVFVSASGEFIFRDRHHRLIRDASVTSQATISATSEPAFSAPLVYDQGWRDIVNSVTLSVDDRSPAAELEAVWTSDATHLLASGETRTIRAELSDPVIGAVVPEPGVDYQLRSGDVTVSLSRTSGASITLFVTASGAGPAVLDTMQLRAYPVTVRSTTQVHAEDSTSIGRYGRRSYTQEAPWACPADAEAIAETILAHYAERLPIVSFRMVSSESKPARLAQQLERDLSDRVTVVDPETGLDGPLFIDRIEHTISQAGRVVESTFGCEKAFVPAGNLLRFDVAGRGFDDGVFAERGVSEASTVFRFDVAGRGLDDGVLAY
jgi:hypothetical protein